MYEYKCKIRKVVDGDIVDIDIDLGFGIWINDERVRIIGIDTRAEQAMMLKRFSAWQQKKECNIY